MTTILKTVVRNRVIISCTFPRHSLLGHGSRGPDCLRSWRSCAGPFWRRVWSHGQVILFLRNIIQYLLTPNFNILFFRDILVCSSRELSEQVLGFLKIYRTERDFGEKFCYFWFCHNNKCLVFCVWKQFGKITQRKEGFWIFSGVLIEKSEISLSDIYWVKKSIL